MLIMIKKFFLLFKIMTDLLLNVTIRLQLIEGSLSVHTFQNVQSDGFRC